jgi:hypothetical protein
MVVFVAWWRWRQRGVRLTEVTLERSHSVELSFLAVATAYSLTLPLKHTVTLIDAAVAPTVCTAARETLAELERAPNVAYAVPNFIARAARFRRLPRRTRRAAASCPPIREAHGFCSRTRPFPLWDHSSEPSTPTTILVIDLPSTRARTAVCAPSRGSRGCPRAVQGPWSSVRSRWSLSPAGPDRAAHAGGFGIAYTTQDDPWPAAELAAGMASIVEHESKAYGLTVPRVSVEPGRAISGPAGFTLYEVGTVKTVELDGGASRVYVAVDGGMSDNIRPALYDADYSCTLAARRSDAAPVLARVVGKHCESGDIVVKDEFLPGDVRPGDLIAVPGTGAYCRSLANTYNHVPRPPVLVVADGKARVIVRRETEEDLLRLDVP